MLGCENIGKKHSIIAFTGILLLLATVPGSVAQMASRPMDAQRPWASSADSLMNIGEWEQALQSYRELSMEHPGDAGLWMRMAVANLRMQKNGAALQAARTAFSLQEDDPDVHLILAQCQTAAGDVDRGAGTLESALQRFPENREILEALTSLYVGIGRNPQAVGLLRELIRLDPGRTSYSLDLGRLFLTMQQDEEALAAFAQARENGADPASCTALEGKAHLMAGRLDPAWQAFQKALALRDVSEAYGGMGVIHFLQGNAEAARQAFQKAIELNPNDADLHFNLGNVLLQLEDWKSAEREYSISLQLDPSSASTHANLGILLLNRFAIPRATLHLQEASRLDPTLPAPFLHLARIEAASFNYEQAFTRYRGYQKAISDSKEIARIDKVIGVLQKDQTRSKAALARGEIHLLQIRVSSLDQATILRRRWRQGEDFYVLAEQESEMSELTGVDAGFVNPADLHPDFRAALSALARQDCTEALQGPQGYYLFYRAE